MFLLRFLPRLSVANSHFLNATVTAAAVLGFVAHAQPLPTNDLPHVTSWIGNTWGAAGARYPALKNNMQMFVEAMSVASDGTVFTSSSWDEAHKEMGCYRDGKDLGQWDELGSADWPKSQWSFNNADGGAVAAGDNYVFLTIDRTINSKQQGPGWFRRYDRRTNRCRSDPRRSTSLAA